VAQILAAVIGAGFVIGLQVAAILSTGTLSRFAVLTSDAAMSLAPAADSLVWWPVRALLGDDTALLSFVAGSLVLLGVTIAVFAPRLGEDVIKASAAAAPAGPRADAGRRFHTVSRQQALRWKELLLLRRDPWLVSQTLMQLLYLLPPALMLWRSFADSSIVLVLITPVIVMAAGQLAGGLAWLTISGEDAPDLVATAPLPTRRVTRAKVEVVLIVIGAVCAPLVIPLVFVAPLQAAVTASGVMIAAMSATAIQLWFRAQARRSQFRRRQTSSRLATFAEAFSSIGWAATAGLALAVPILALFTALMTSGLLAITWKISPKRA
jgi:ABC-2 type transport system permease protein